MGPSCDTGGGAALGVALTDCVGAAATTEVTAVVSSAAGGVHPAVVTILAVAVSFTDVTEVALDATAIWASRPTGVFGETELMVQ
jgi:hypothetical protein